jgi:hypothetical protein
MKQAYLLARVNEVRDVFNLRASDKLTTPSVPIGLSVVSEHEMKQQVCYCRG